MLFPYLYRKDILREFVRTLLLVIMILLFGISAEAKEKPEELYAQSAVLMDAATGRVLFEKDGDAKKAMASTTKIMTCILALEECELEEVVTFSEEACRQPEVHLNASLGEQFYLEDMLYSLMLESHNDVAVAIAECVSGSVENFAKLMNQKAKEIGCENTYFITPNGLDAEDEKGFHSTTAKDLAKIMSYCIQKSTQKDRFLEITSKANHIFSNIEGDKTYSCTNHNSYLHMNTEAISGKTGYTGKAGYCYVGAVESEGRNFVVSLLACGWPNHKTYKWQDMKEIITYAMDEFQLQEFPEDLGNETLHIVHGKTLDGLFGTAKVELEIQREMSEVMIGKNESIQMEIQVPEMKEAPIEEGEMVGKVIYKIENENVAECPIVAKKSIKRIDFWWIFSRMIELYLK